MIQTLAALKASIYESFANVELGNGIGLREGQGLDDFYTEEALSALRLLDEKEDWLKLSEQDLNEYYSAISHLDAEGMRFHLPAYLILDLDKKYIFHLCFSLIRLDLYDKKNKFKLLNKAQRLTVANYLTFLLERNELHLNDMADAKKALCEYWLVEPNEA